MGITRYIKWHRVKVQADATYATKQSLVSQLYSPAQWIFRFQVELGI